MDSARETALDLIRFIDASPSPYHAAAEALRRLTGAGFTELPPADAWPSGPGRYVVVDGGSLFAWIVPEGAAPGSRFRLLGAHTDSPTLRVKPRPDTGRAGIRQLGVEVYGGPLLNSWLDRDLGLAGRVVVRTPGGPQVRLVRVHRPLLRIPQLAIHLDPGVREGLKLDAQQHLVPIWSLGDPEPGEFASVLAKELGLSPGDVLSHDVVTYDLTGGTLAGAGEEFISSARLDNLACSHASVTALGSTALGDTAGSRGARQRHRAVRQRGDRQPDGHRGARRLAGAADGAQRARPRRRPR